MTDLLTLVVPALPPELVTSAAARRLAAVMAHLPVTPTLGFECRLGADDRVDLQVAFHAEDGETAALGAGDAPLPGPWERVERLRRAWRDDAGPLHGCMSELWLEFDTPDGPSSDPYSRHVLLPSVFAVLARGGSARALAGAHAVADAVFDPARAVVASAAIDRIAAACAPRGWVSHVGAMLGRPVAGLRVHVTDLPLAAVPGFLAGVGWDGDVATVADTARCLLGFADSVVVCLDVLDGLVRQVAVESFFLQNRGVDPRWPDLLAWLVDAGLARPDKAAALVRWPAALTPPEAAARWPDRAIVTALTRAPTEFDVIERRLSHVKVVFAPGAPVTAKAYFGSGVLWESVGARATRLTTPVVPRGSSSVADAVGGAVEALLHSRNQAGWWRDFLGLAKPAEVGAEVTRYASDEWVSAYAACALAGAGRPDAVTAAEQAYGLLLGRRVGLRGWGYHARVPPDADSTTWVLRLAERLGVPGSARLAAAREFVTGLTGADGGVATYARHDVAELEAFLGLGLDYAAWCMPHGCVTAVAAALRLAPGSSSWLLSAQRTDGSWTGHWWSDPEYATALAAESLAAVADRTGAVDAALARAARWAADRISADGAVRAAGAPAGSAFATALALRTVLAAVDRSQGLPEPAARATVWLLARQRSGGGWAPSARLRVPMPDDADPEASGRPVPGYLDDTAVFTTATVLDALTVVAWFGAPT